jgi:drug/metabolite transporter (DMT)-like permease
MAAALSIISAVIGAFFSAASAMSAPGMSVEPMPASEKAVRKRRRSGMRRGFEWALRILDAASARARRGFSATMNARILGIGGALGATLAWGGQFPVFAGVLHDLDAYWLTAVRGVAGAVILIGLLLAIEGPRALQLGERPWRVAALGLIGFTVFGDFLLLGVARSGPQHAALIMATTPLLATLLAWVRSGARPTPLALGLTLLAFAGVALVVTKGDVVALAHEGSWLGDLFLLIGALAWAYYTLEAAAYREWSALRLTTLTVAFGTLGLIAVALVAVAVGAAPLPPAHAFAAAVPGMLYLVLVGPVFAIFAWAIGVKALGSARTVLFMNAVPITTFTIEIALGVRFHLVEYLGAALTLTALFLNGALATRRPAEARA